VGVGGVSQSVSEQETAQVELKSGRVASGVAPARRPECAKMTRLQRMWLRMRRAFRSRLRAPRREATPQVRGLHSSTFQLNLSRFSHIIHPQDLLILPKTS